VDPSHLKAAWISGDGARDVARPLGVVENLQDREVSWLEKATDEPIADVAVPLECALHRR
jgi:hypothetical protein